MLILPPHIHELSISAKKRHFFKFRPQSDIVKIILQPVKLPVFIHIISIYQKIEKKMGVTMLILPPHIHELSISAKKRHFFKFRPQSDIVKIILQQLNSLYLSILSVSIRK